MKNQIADYKPDRDFWNIAKGIGILFIMFGHAVSGTPNKFVYMFHIPLFFFISGYLFSEDKYGDKPFVNCKKRILRLWLPFSIIEAVFVLLHNVLYKHNLLRATDYAYGLRELAIRLVKAFLGAGDEMFVGPIWFLHTLALSLIVFGFIVCFSRLFEQKLGVVVKFVIQIMCIVSLTLVGYYYLTHHIQLFADAQISFILMPYLYVGYLLRNYIGDIDKYINYIIGLVAAIVVFIFAKKYMLELTLGIAFPLMFIPGFCGIYFSLSLSKGIKQISVFKGVFSFVGKISFYLMCTHFAVYRIMDRIMCNMSGDYGQEKYSILSVSFPERWWVYLLIGIPISVLVSYGIQKLVLYVMKVKKSDGEE